MSVRQRKWTDKTGKVQTAWVVDVVFALPNGSEKRVTKTSPVNTRLGALEYERQLRGELLAGTYKQEQVKCITLAEFEAQFMEHATNNNKASQQKTKRDILRKHLIPAFGALKLDEITAEKVESYKAQKLKEDLKAKTVNNQLGVLHKALSLAVKWEKLAKMPEFEWLDEDEAAFDFLTFEEADRLVSAFDPRWKNMAIVALNTGLRLGELSALQWDAIDLQVGRLRVIRNVYRRTVGKPKGGKSREVPLNQKAIEALKDQRKRVVGPTRVFLNGQNNPIDTYNGPSDWIARACRQAGLRNVGWHVLRHTFASHLVMRGVSLKAVQELLGHATLEMTMRYAHLAPSIKADAVALLDTLHPRNTDPEMKKAPITSGA